MFKTFQFRYLFMSIVIFGSINMDLVVRAPHLPVAGETVKGRDFFTAPGGKGANQAVACARQGAEAIMVGRLGNDVFADALCDNLKASNVSTEYVLKDMDNPSGVALISVDDSSENTIIVVAGVNGAVNENDVKRLEKALVNAEVLLLQLEIPMAAVLEGAAKAKAADVSVILDPAPAQALPAELYKLCDIITPNEVEAEHLVGFPVKNKKDAEKAARVLLNRGVKQVIIKMGAKGAYWSNGDFDQIFNAYQVRAIDTVAAGDAFNGGLAVGLANGMPIREAIQWGMATGALSTTKQGAQPSMPEKDEVEKLFSGKRQ